VASTHYEPPLKKCPPPREIIVVLVIYGFGFGNSSVSNTGIEKLCERAPLI